MPDIYRGLAGYNLLSSGYWERKSNLSGGFDGIIANDNAIGQFYLEVRGTDAALKTACPLTRLEHAPQPTENNPSKLAPGTYLIGRDIQPGLYRGQAGTDFTSSCYWQRTSNVSGEMGSILANDNATGQYFVEVFGSDFALKTGCELERVR